VILKVDQGDYNWSSRQREFDQRVNAVSVGAALLCPKTKNRLALATQPHGFKSRTLGLSATSADSNWKGAARWLLANGRCP